jgi:hypothetical protein
VMSRTMCKVERRRVFREAWIASVSSGTLDIGDQPSIASGVVTKGTTGVDQRSRRGEGSSRHQPALRREGPDHQANLADTLAACAFVLIELGSLSQDYVVCYSVDGQARRVRPLRPGRKKYSPPRTVTNGGMGDRK